jgi:hypothetical protein
MEGEDDEVNHTDGGDDVVDLMMGGRGGRQFLALAG